MKKLLLILLLFVSLISQGQMIRKDSVGAIAYGMKFNYIHFAPKTHSEFGIIFLHGIGERGPADGSNLSSVLRNGYPKHAQAGFEFPFHIIAPQCVSSYAQIKNFMPSWFKLAYNIKVVYVVGLSMGGGGAFETGYNDNLRQVDGVVPICGWMDPKLAVKWREIPGWAFHGDQDKTVPYIKSKAFVDAYNKTHTTQWKYRLYPGVGHNSWDKACSVTPGQDELLQWLKAQFAAYPKEPKGFDLEKFKVRLDSLIDTY